MLIANLFEIYHVARTEGKSIDFAEISLRLHLRLSQICTHFNTPIFSNLLMFSSEICKSCIDSRRCHWQKLSAEDYGHIIYL